MAYTKTGVVSFASIYGSGQQKSMSDIRDYHGITGAVSLNGSLYGGAGGPVSPFNPGQGQSTTMDQVTSNGRIVTKIGTTQIITSGTSWTPRETYSDVLEYSVHIFGAGGSGGGSSTHQQREGAAAGGGGGGSVFFTLTNDDFSDPASPSATITIGAGGSSHSYGASDNSGKTGYNGGNTTWTSNGQSRTGRGGYRGFKSRQGPYNASSAQVTATHLNGVSIPGGSTATGTGSDWGQAASGFGQGTVIQSGDVYSVGGNGPGTFQTGDGKYASAGGSPGIAGNNGNNGAGVAVSGYNQTANTSPPTLLGEWESDVTSAQFQGGRGAMHSSGSAGTPTGVPGYGGGSGGSCSEQGAGGVRTGGSGAILVTYFGSS